MKPTLRWLASFGAIALVVVLGLAFAACGSSGSDSSAANTSEDEALHVEEDGQSGGDLHVEGDGDADGAHGDVQEFAVATSDLFRYEPAEIIVQAGEPVRIALDNSGSVILHDFTVDGLPAADVHSEGVTHGHDAAATADDHADQHEDHVVLHVAAEPGGAGVLEFTPTEPGEYVFYCTVPGHREAGMEGTITVLG